MRCLPAVVLALLVLARTASAHPPTAGPVEVFASAVDGPEGLAFTRGGRLVVGSATGELRQYAVDGSFTVLANLGEPLAGITVLRDRRVLAASLGPGRVWAVDRNGGATVFASGIGGPNFIVETRRRRVYVSASSSGMIMEITGGVPVPRASGLTFPNGLAIGRDGYLYVAETSPGRISRLLMARDGTLGTAEVYATGLPVADGIAFDRADNLYVVGADALSVVDPRTRAVSLLSADPLLDWPANIAFGRSGRFRRRDVYLANFGFPLGTGTTVVRFRTNHSGARLSR
jgi:sugar lactone lactonase YvrE